jgi:hypothetical protein
MSGAIETTFRQPRMGQCQNAGPSISAIKNTKPRRLSGGVLLILKERPGQMNKSVAFTVTLPA